MGVRGELFSTRMACDGRTYFFNVKENRMGDLFLTIVESKPTEDGDFDRRSVVIFQDNAADFIKTLQKSLDAMNEAAPSDRAKKPPRTRRDAMAPRDDGRDSGQRLSDEERPRHYIDTGKPRGSSPAAPRGGERRTGDKRNAEQRNAEQRNADQPSRPSRDGGRQAALRRDIDRATGRSSRDADDAARAAGGRPSGGTGRVLRVKPRAGSKPAAAPADKPRARRLTVKKADPRHED